MSGRNFPVNIRYRSIRDESDHLKEIEFLLTKKFFNYYKKNGNLKNKYEGHVLVFVSGIDDILYLIERCKHNASPKKFILLPLHGRLSFEEQAQAFMDYNDKIKVLLISFMFSLKFHKFYYLLQNKWWNGNIKYITFI